MKCLNSLKVHIFGMCKLRLFDISFMQIGCCWKLDPTWPFVKIPLTIHPTHSKLYIFVILITSLVIWYTPLDPYWERAKSSKILSKYFLAITTSKPSVTHLRKMAFEYLFHYNRQFVSTKTKDRYCFPFHFTIWHLFLHLIVR